MKNPWENEKKQLLSEESNQVSSNQGLFEKILNLFGFEAEEVVDDSEVAATSAVYDEPVRKGNRERDRGKLVSLANANKSAKMVIIEPSGFEEVQMIVDHLKNRQTVILNLEETDKAVARRIADFIGGAIYALDGSMQKVSGSIFLFTPANVEVSIPIRTMIKEKEKESDRNNIPASLSSTLFRNDHERDNRRD